jgi:hypothetical protein
MNGKLLLIFVVFALVSGGTGSGISCFPEKIYFRTGRETFNSRYDFVISECRIWYRPRNGRAGDWKPLPLHKDLTCPKLIDTDSETFIALDSLNTIYTMFGALKTRPEKFKWTRHWGAPFRLGRGMRVPAAHNGLAFSYLSPTEDEYYRTSNGNKYDVGMGVANIFFLNEKGQRITYLDPWLPNDFSYEVGGPRRGRFRSVNISASGSTLFLINRYGDMYTRTYDFDMAGADNFFFNYSYDEKDYTVEDTSDVLPRRVPRPLPVAGWTRQPKITGDITDLIMVIKQGKGTVRRELRVEGRDGQDRTGYYTKDISGGTWHFVETGLALSGNMLENTPEDRSDMTLGPDESMAFEYRGKDLAVVIPDFHPYCPPATVTVMFGNGSILVLRLHFHETIRQRKRKRGLTDKKLVLRGALEVADSLRRKTGKPEGPAGRFISRYFKKSAFSEVKIKATRSKIKIAGARGLRWTLTRSEK